MVRRTLAYGGLLLLLLAGCSHPAPPWRTEASAIVDRVRREGAPYLLPTEYKSLEDSYVQAEVLFRQDKLKEADSLYYLTWSKGKLLQENLTQTMARQAREAEARAEAQRQQQKTEEEQRRAREQAEAAARTESLARAEVRRRTEPPRPIRQKPLPTSHTVKLGETLPLIAAQSEVYGDATLWPLLYRANRDQIRDPRHLWPGQVLRIPRTFSREDLAEARRFAQDKQLF